MTNQQKAQIISELRLELKIRLSIILEVVGMSSSSYHYSHNHIYGRNRKSEELVQKIKDIREKNIDYGYRTVTSALRNMGIIVNHKAVLRIMRKNDLLCHAYERKTRKLNTYKGSVGKVAKNILNRRFKTDRPFQKIVTDVTEVRWGNETREERAYFTAFIDIYSGEIITWNIGLKADMNFVMKPLEELIAMRPQLNYRMMIHSDQGFHYQNNVYVQSLKKNRIIQSMSRKATCLDNAVAESVFHILKIGTTHNFDYETYEDLRKGIEEYVYYYNNKRIRTKLAGKTPVEYRNLSDQLIA
ncbi:IS3 family transposase [Clostridium botulinum]|uniref:IS3 family transposase n=1 Tax=Clostridium botulinum TaxID=1491 RepID=UPI00217ED840|nr:IS3 family transposase [Clostridium botulinum]